MDEGRDNAGSGDLNAARDLNIRGWLRLSRHNPEVMNIYMEITNEGKEAFLITGIRSGSCPSIYGVNFNQDDTEQAAKMFTHFTIPRKMTLVPRGGSITSSAVAFSLRRARRNRSRWISTF